MYHPKTIQYVLPNSTQVDGRLLLDGPRI